MSNLNTSASQDKGASDNLCSPLSVLQDKLTKHRTFHRRVKAINGAFRKVEINPADANAAERSREVLREVLGDERLVEMYFRQLWPLCSRMSRVLSPASVLARNGHTIRSIKESIKEVGR